MTHPGPPEMLQKNMILYFLFSLGFFSFFFPKSGWFYEISADSEYESLLLTDTRHVFIASVKAIMKLCCWIQLHCKFQKKPKWGSNEVFFFHTWTVSGISWHRFKWANFGKFGDWVGTGYGITVLRWSHVKVFLCLEEKWNLLTADALYTILNVFKTQTKLLWLFCNLSVKWSPCFFGIMQYKLELVLPLMPIICLYWFFIPTIFHFSILD